MPAENYSENTLISERTNSNLVEFDVVSTDELNSNFPNLSHHSTASFLRLDSDFASRSSSMSDSTSHPILNNPENERGLISIIDEIESADSYLTLFNGLAGIYQSLKEGKSINEVTSFKYSKYKADDDIYTFMTSQEKDIYERFMLNQWKPPQFNWTLNTLLPPPSYSEKTKAKNSAKRKMKAEAMEDIWCTSAVTEYHVAWLMNAPEKKWKECALLVNAICATYKDKMNYSIAERQNAKKIWSIVHNKQQKFDMERRMCNHQITLLYKEIERTLEG